MKKVNVNIGDRSYPITIAYGLLDNKELIDKTVTANQVCIVSNDTVAPLYLKKLTDQLQKQGRDIIEVILPDGEQYKNLEQINKIYDALMANRFNRDAQLIALGGGVVGDMAGFAAACFLRGIDFIQIPTSLLAQVDSSVGGKTGVNHPLGKNMIGAFHQPKAVLIDTQVLSTLPARQISAGLAEVIKYGLIIDAEFFNWLEKNIPNVLALEQEAIYHVIERSCQIKADVVAKDEKEHGIRAYLNLGHTFGHAIESLLQYKDWFHGEAVAAGSVLAATLSHNLKLIHDDELSRTIAIFKQANLPTEPPAQLKADDVYNTMLLDKKARSKAIHLILLNSIGDAFVSADYDPALLDQLLKKHFS